MISPPDREEKLLAILDHEPFLVVLDGLERILIAYARMDAARLSDEEVGRQNDNLLRKTTDPRAGAFLRKLSACRAARVLISTRLTRRICKTGSLATRCPALLSERSLG